MWGAHCGVLWPQPSSTSQGGQAHRAPRQTPSSFAGDGITRWQCGTRLTTYKAYYAFFETRATNSSSLESKSFRMGESFDFL